MIHCKKCNRELNKVEIGQGILKCTPCIVEDNRKDAEPQNRHENRKRNSMK
jgi:hypothetical protein